MPHRLALDQEILHAIHDVRTWGLYTCGHHSGRLLRPAGLVGHHARRIGRLSDGELRKIRDVAEGRSGYDSLVTHESYQLALDLVPRVTTRQSLDFLPRGATGISNPTRKRTPAMHSNTPARPATAPQTTASLRALCFMGPRSEPRTISAPTNSALQLSNAAYANLKTSPELACKFRRQHSDEKK